MAMGHLGRYRSMLAMVVASSALLAACSGTGGDSGGSANDSEFSYLGQTENSTIVNTLKSLGQQQCSDASGKAALKADAVAATQYDQKLQLLAGQNSLPDLSMAAGTPALMKQFIDAKQLQNLTESLTELGVSDKVLPAAASTIKALYGQNAMYALPTEFNIEGFWYNKKLLADNGIAPPKTWSDLTAAAEKLKAANVQAFAADGKDGWPITRLVGNYLFRSLGPDALQKVADGKAKLTDPEYVKAADEVAALGKAGYFGKAVGSVDYNAAVNLFLTGKAAFFYMGSWALANFNDAAQNQIGGPDGIGFFAFPDVAGGAGKADQVPANVGIPVMVSKKGYNDSTKAWLKCVVANYGDAVLASGVVSGFTVGNPPANLPSTTKTVQQTIKDAPSSVLWFEALFSSKGTTVSQTNGGGLANGTLSGAEFMKLVQNGQ